jgi:hypothetical protein
VNLLVGNTSVSVIILTSLPLLLRLTVFPRMLLIDQVDSFVFSSGSTSARWRSCIRSSSSLIHALRDADWLTPPDALVPHDPFESVESQPFCDEFVLAHEAVEAVI